MSQDIVADALNQIRNAKRARKSEIEIIKHSKLLISVLALAKLRGYIKDYKLSKTLKIHIGHLNDCKAIKPRFTVTVPEIEKYEKRYLPSQDIGILIISTSKGLMTNTTARERNIGGSLIAFMY